MIYYKYIIKSTDIPNAECFYFHKSESIFDSYISSSIIENIFLEKYPESKRENIQYDSKIISEEEYIEYNRNEEYQKLKNEKCEKGYYYITYSFDNLLDLLPKLSQPYEVYTMRQEIYLRLFNDTPMVEDFYFKRVTSSENTYYYLLEHGKKLSLSKKGD